MINKFLIIIIGFVMLQSTSAQPINVLEKIINQNYKSLSPAIKNLDKYEIQIILTEVNKEENGRVNFQTYLFNEKPNKYFYPASTVKFPAVICALEKLNDIGIKGVNKFTHLTIDSVYNGLVSFDKNFRNECGYPNIANYIKQIFIVSDNQSFNRLYDFLGQKELNDRLKKRGLTNTKIVHRLSVARTRKQNMETNPVKFYDEEGKLIYEQAARFDSTDVKLNLTSTLKGKGFITDGKLIEQPKDFSENNFFGLRDQHELLKRIFFPEQFEKSKRFNLTDEDYSFLKKYMCMLPRESECPKYDSTEYYDGYVKFLMFGDTKEQIPGNIKIYSKSGLAYGYLTDNAYIVDTENNIEFFLSATIHVNENQIFNDDNYEYDEIGLPFLANLGKAVYKYEKERNNLLQK